MMKHLPFLFAVGFVLGFSQCAYSQVEQTYINTEWSFSKGDLGQYKIVKSEVAPNGTIVTIANDDNGSNTDMLVTCTDEDGNLLWQTNLASSSTEDDYGSDLEIDANGNIYIAGTYHTGTDLDYYMAKLSSTGSVLWQQTYNGGFGEDVPSEIILAPNDDVIVTGASIGTDTLADFATLRLSQATGTVQWSTRYDPLNRQVGISLAIDSNGDVYVTGSTFSSQLTSDIVTIKYNGTTGAELLEKVLQHTGNGADIPKKIICDGSKLYIVGMMDYGTPNSDGFILCYDGSLQLQWQKDIDGAGYRDQCNDISFESSSSNLLVTGYQGRTAFETNLFLGSYSASNGSENWSYIRPSFDETHSAEGHCIRQHSSGDIFVSGTETRASKDAILLKYSSQGIPSWTRYLDLAGEGDEGFELSLLSDVVYLHGASEENGQYTATTTKYAWTDRELVIQTNEENDFSYIKNQFIIQFNRSVLIMPTIDDTGIEFGDLSRFVDSSFLADLVNETEMDWDRYKAYKIHRGATSADSVSISRDGREIHLDDFWGSLVVEVEGGYDDTTLQNILGNNTKIHNIQYDIVYSFDNAPNDTYYTGGYQLGLNSNTTYPNAGINVEDAWDIEVGKDYIKVGVFDALIDWSHFEFGQAGTLADSKVAGGYDYYTNADISNGNYVEYSHGTQIAGIIGAHRNEGAGIAGIAGGDLQNDPINDRGVQLFSMGVSIQYQQTVYFATSSIIAEATEEGALATTNGYGYGLHVQNHSYGSTYYPDPIITDAIKTCQKNLSVVVASRGNQGNASLGQTNPAQYPACLEDRLVLSVIASGYDGERKDDVSNGTGTWSSSYGKAAANQIPGCDADFMAPGVVQLISTTRAQYDLNANNSACLVPTTQNNSRYSCMNGTSAAAPHVAGVASLMYSHHVPAEGYPNVLGTEDIEEILQKTTTDNLPTGYDWETGHGRIDAYEALRQVDHPYYVLHKVYDNSDATMNWVSNYSNPNIATGYSGSGTAIFENMDHADCYRFVWQISESLPSGHEILDAWEFQASWNGGGPYASTVSFIAALNNQFATNGGIWPSIGSNTYTAFASTFLYYVTDNNGNQFWYPFPPSELSWGFSLHVNAATASVDEHDELSLIKLYPNPAQSYITVNFEALQDDATEYQVHDASGRCVLKAPLKQEQQSVDINVETLDFGMYYVTLLHSGGRTTEAFIKNE